jgi:hypothetical protein
VKVKAAVATKVRVRKVKAVTRANDVKGKPEAATKVHVRKVKVVRVVKAEATKALGLKAKVKAAVAVTKARVHKVKAKEAAIKARVHKVKALKAEAAATKAHVHKVKAKAEAAIKARVHKVKAKEAEAATKAHVLKAAVLDVLVLVQLLAVHVEQLLQVNLHVRIVRTRAITRNSSRIVRALEQAVLH